LIYYVRIS